MNESITYLSIASLVEFSFSLVEDPFVSWARGADGVELVGCPVDRRASPVAPT